MSEKKKLEMREKIIMTALSLAGSQGWEYVTLKDVARAAEISMSDLYELIDDKNDILILLGRMIDKRVMEGASVQAEVSPKEALFDLLMDRYEILNDYRDGLIAILDSFKYDPKQILLSSPHLCRSMSWMLEASGIETTGIKGMLKITGLTGLYIKVLKVWMKDESSDLSAVMAALDKDLSRAENYADMLGL